jgi:hypothetical protein
MLSFTEARDRATEQLAPDWGERPGTFYVAPWGFQDAEDYLVIVGAQEFIEGLDTSYVSYDDLVTYVDKDTGEVTTSSFMLDQKRILAMTPAGAPEPV